MATTQQKAHTLLWYAKFESSIPVQVHLDMSMVWHQKQEHWEKVEGIGRNR